ncbi:hypothetical protein A2368_02595, partial [Candidatus Collierbacteria bacterium RIFOXYB1_FULL_49_13]
MTGGKSGSHIQPWLYTRPMSSSDLFDQAYKALNPAQKQAVDTIEGPLMVIAGPGTGKTQVLTLRIANILKTTDTQPENILVLTYTESAAQNMRTRLVTYIGPTAYRLRLGTFHSVCQSIIGEYQGLFALPPSASAMTDLDRFKIITKLLDQGHFESIRPPKAPTLYLRDILSLIQQLKREHISPESYLQSLDLPQAKLDRERSQILKNREFAKIYSGYQQYLEETAHYDFEDMINRVVDKLQEDKNFRLELQEKFQYFLIDEYQDTNTAQNTFIDLLSEYWKETANVFVVGDDEQSIFRFQGASLENILNFNKRYPNAPILSLTQNYRSQQFILDGSRYFIDHNQISLSKSLPHINRTLISSTTRPPLPLQLVPLVSSIAQADYITTKVQSLLNSGVPASEIAIIASRHRDFADIQKLFDHHQLPYKRLSGDNLLDHPIIRQFMTILQTIDAISRGEEYLDLFTIMHYPFFGLSPDDILRQSRYAHTHRVSLFEALKDSPTLSHFIDLLETWHQLSRSAPLSTFCRLLLRDSGLLDYCKSQEDVLDLLNSLNSFIVFVTGCTESRPDLSLTEFLSDINLLTTHGIPVEATPLVQGEAAVTFTTAHKAKGLEWDHVFIVDLTDNAWGGRPRSPLLKPPPTLLSQPLADESLEESRRLFYVALTRARLTVTLTYPQQILSGTTLRPTTPNRFIAELSQKLITISTLSTASPLPTLTALLSPSSPPSPNETEIIDEILKTFSLSPSSLDDYLDCPYRFKWLRLLNLQTPPNLSLALGNATHEALAQFNLSLKNTTVTPPLDYLLTTFTRTLQNQLLPETEHRSAHSSGITFLTAYYHFFQDKFTPPLFVERRFGGVTRPIISEGVPLNGKIDRIELAVGDNHKVKLIDYKT